MKYISDTCIDAGTAGCPCPLAETGACLVCSRLSGRDKCDCKWCGLCIYNEFIQNDGAGRNKRKPRDAEILERRWYGPDVLVMEIKVDRGFAMSGMDPGTFVFLNGTDDPFFNVPVSIMRTDMKRGAMSFAIKVISAKTKALAGAKGRVKVRGVYRNGLLGDGLRQGFDALKHSGGKAQSLRWLFITKGVGFAPAVNILDRLPAGVSADMVIDTEKVTEEMVSDSLSRCEAVKAGRVKMEVMPLNRLLDRDDEAAVRCVSAMGDYDKVFILASDHYINMLSSALNVPDSKLVYANNFHMCCGEGICGACCHTDSDGNIHKMCKCRQKE